MNTNDTNIIELTDSYKPTHWKVLLPGTTHVYSYLESRKGAQFDETVFFGLQYLLKKYLAGVQVTKAKIDEAEALFKVHFGTDKYFNRAGWEHILNKHGGKLPIRIQAVAEGTPVPTNNVLMTIVNTDPEVPWLTNYVETLLTHVWSASTVATLSRSVKKVYAHYLDRTSDNPGGINFMLHDFGYRGVSSHESAGFEGAGHLVNFSGTDTLAAMRVAINYYGANIANLAFSVAATEHSIMTGGGREGEDTVTQHVLDQFPTGVVSVVGDSYNIYEYAKRLGTTFKAQVLNREGIFVLRPDSGDPEEVVLKLLGILGEHFGFTINRKGYRVLHPKIRLIWGDGIDKRGIENVLGAMMINGWSAENIVFGMGGGLLQKINRDTQRFAFKCCAQKRNGIWYEIFKDPIDGSKASKRGFLKLVKNADGAFETVRINDLNDNEGNLLNVVFEDGVIVREYTFDEIRDNAKL
jgi:nicotinamide phosphoribosyltransferase